MLSTPDHEVTPSELMTGGSPRNAAREAQAKKAREDYYTGLRRFAENEDIAYADENGEPFYSACGFAPRGTGMERVVGTWLQNETGQ